MSGITFSGLGTGIDTGAMITQLVSLERAPILQMQGRQSQYRSQLSIIQNLNSKLQGLQTQAEGLKTAEDFLAYSTESSDDDYISVSATGNATQGSFSVEVDWLAQAERRYSDSFASKDTAGNAGNGTLSLEIGEEDVVDIEVTSEDTLETIVQKINSSEADASASLFYDGSNYRIQMNGNETGEINEIVVTESAGLNLGLDNVANRYQEAKDAQIKMDGYTISSASNEVADVIQGVTLNLKDTTESAVNINITANQEQISEKVTSFINSYNEVHKIIHSEFDFTGESKNGGHLTGDSTLRSIQLKLSIEISNVVSGLGSSFSALSQIGISTSTDGTLEVDAEDLEAAIGTDALGVAQLFAGSTDHTIDGVADSLDELIESFIDFSGGVLTEKSKGINQIIANLDESIERKEDQITMYESKIRAQFTAMEMMVSSLTSQSNFISTQQGLW